MKFRTFPGIRRILSALLCLALVLSCCPAVFADTDLQITCTDPAHIHTEDSCITPEVTEPEVTEPEVSEPEVSEPEVTEPEVTEPEVTEPEVTEPEVTEPVLELLPPVTAAVPVAEAMILPADENTVYFDLSLGNITIKNGVYSGMVWVKEGETFTQKTVTGNHSNRLSYYVFQSSGETNRGYVEYTGDTVSAVHYPEYAPVMADSATPWADYLKNPAVHTDVAAVVGKWSSAVSGTRTATAYRIDIRGAESYRLTVRDIWSSYCGAGSSRDTGGIGFVPSSKDSGEMGLIFVGDNRLENIHYSSKSHTNRLFIGGATSDATLTVASTTAGGNTYNSAIGGSDNNGEAVQALELTGSGVLYAGARHNDACSAIGGGGNGYALISITSGTVVAVTAYNGAAIGGGFGGSSPGGNADVVISGGKVYAYNTGVGAAIGGGSSNAKGGGYGNVTISGGTVIADTKGNGAAIGGGSSASSTAGTGTVTISASANVTATSAGAHSIGGGYGSNGSKNGGSTVRLPMDVSASDSKVSATFTDLHKFLYNDGPSGASGAIYFSGSTLPNTDDVVYPNHYMDKWVVTGTDTPWAMELDQAYVYEAKWLPVTNSDTFYFDLALGNVKITGSTYAGWIYQKDMGKAIRVQGKHNSANKYYVYQSSDANRATTGLVSSGEVTVPQYDRVSGWAGYITNNDNVTDVVNAWPGKASAVGRDSTSYHVQVTGNSTYALTIDNIWSNYCEVNTSRSTAGVAFLPTGSGKMVLTYKGDNRLEALHYSSSSSQRLTLQGESGGDTLTVAATNDGGNFWCSAIGGNDADAYTHNLYISRGTLFAGTRRQDNCTAIGAGGNGYGSVYISGTTVTAVVSSSGTAIGGGIGYHSAGGDAYVEISGGKVYAYNHGILLKDTASGSPFQGQFFAVPATAIGGGSSIESDGNANTTIRITGGEVYAQSVHGAAIGGGGSSTKNGGKANIQITGGKVTATSIAGKVYGIKDGGNDYSHEFLTVEAGVSIGGGTGHLSGGYADLTVSGENTTVKTGSIGGGAASAGNPLGYARVAISGGRIQGQVVMQQTSVENEYCSFLMTGGTIDNSLHKQAKTASFSDGSHTYTFLEENGGAVCMRDTNGVTTIRGGTIQNCYGENGGAVYMTGGSFVMEQGENNTTGSIQSCLAENEGGAVYLGGGTVTLLDGAVTQNSAGNNGGGIGVRNGKIVMAGGKVDNNTAITGNGGGMYVSSTGSDVAVKIYSGSVSGNNISKNGGAVAVEGHANSRISVQIGANKSHFQLDENGKPQLALGFTHTEEDGTFVHNTCPVIKNNASSTSGGAFYITGGSETKLDLYCLTETGNDSKGDLDVHGSPLSTFLMVEGGAVVISTSDCHDYDEVTFDDAGYGNMEINGDVHVRAGTLSLYGTMDNPAFNSKITVDLPHEDGFKDYRGSYDKIKLSYHENFTGKDSIYQSTQTATDVASGTLWKVSDSLYSHDGYRIHGWNVDRTATIDTEGGWFWPNDTYTLLALAEGEDAPYTDFDNHIHHGDLTIYAIWEAIGYRLQFMPGCSQYQGDMEEIAVNYDETKALPANGFIRPGYCFSHWSYLTDEGTPATLQNGQNITNLTQKANWTVVLTAQWTPCDHTDTTFTYTADGNVLAKHCDKCHYEATATLSADNATYDGQRHSAALVCSDAAFWNPEVRYTGLTLKPANAAEDWTASSIPTDKLCINAGDYTARIAQGDSAVEVTYQIRKAKQPAPAARPSYTQPKNDNILTVHQIPVGDRLSAVSGAHVEYFVRYYTGGIQINEFLTRPTEDPDDLAHTLTAALKTYAVFALYPETDNYLASDEIAAESTFIFGGKLHITVLPTEGIDFWPGDASDTEQSIHVKLRDGFYLVGDDFTFQKQITNGSAYDLSHLSIVPGSEDDQYVIRATAADEDTKITITLGTAKPIPTIQNTVKEKQVFGDFTADAAPTISRDSAFTVRYTVTAYDTAAYQMPKLLFATPLPAGTKLILRDRKDGSYWHRTLSSSTATVALDDFTRMGGSDGYTVSSGDLDLQLVIDFSGTDPIAGTSVTVTLLVEKIDLPGNTPPDLTVNSGKNKPDAYADLGDVSFRLEKPSEQPADSLTQALTLSYSGPAASKWDHRDAALVVDAQTVLPPSTTLQVFMGSHRAVCYPDENGRFILPLGEYIGLGTQTIRIRLQSELFPKEYTEYALTASLQLSATDAEVAPMNGQTQGVCQTLNFSSNEAPYEVKIVHSGNLHLFDTGENLTVNVYNDIPSGYRMFVELQRQYQDGTFADTGIKAAVNGNAYSYELSFPGNYRIVAKINRADQYSDGYTIDSAYYYFIVQ